MRALAIPVMLVLAGLASAPGAIADPVPDACPEKHIATNTQPQHSVDVDADCSATVELNRGIICAGPWGTTDTFHVGPVTLISHRCTFPGGGPEPVDAVAVDGPCGKDYTNGVVTVTTEPDCAAQIDVKLYDCVWGGHWDTVVAAGPLTVRQYECHPPGGDPA